MRCSVFMLGVLLAAACTRGETPAPAEDAEADAQKRAPAEIIAEAAPEDWRAIDPENMLVVELERGRVVVELSSTLAQNHTAQMKALAREGFYDGLSFYRVIDGFVAQGGDVFEQREVKTAKKTLEAMFDQPLTADMTFTPIEDTDGYAAQVGFIDSQPVGADAGGTTIWALHCTGAMAMARDIEKDTGGTEFYFTLQPQRYLDRNLTVFGHVVDGMEHLQALPRVVRAETPGDDVSETILSMRVAADLAEDKRPALEILRTDTATFAAYAESRRNRPEDFFYYRPDHVDVCALTIPVREIAAE
ncbi:peptidylprolyl isomerase [Hyphococcus luteus]|uniref:peptidylprolyl isomerase n=1 Tax=Hyphococcus luteus TaxID=2058213 RepID=A0A2S7K3P2_9PROT|nr:peptidylprolyl isomerase [Marinicaulis flavus]PQA87119.1 peptidylprolyl isomerase [Marinicaulis flavus]